MAKDNLDPYSSLAAAVIIQAARDASNGNLEAMRWLEKQDTRDTWYQLCDLSDHDVLSWLRKVEAKFAWKIARQRRNGSLDGGNRFGYSRSQQNR